MSRRGQVVTEPAAHTAGMMVAAMMFSIPLVWVYYDFTQGPDPSGAKLAMQLVLCLPIPALLWFSVGYNLWYIATRGYRALAEKLEETAGRRH